ncbi:MAG TPA: alpha-ketoglutarate-dependent dioxygenase AlkB [Rhodanobacteraceae bacterium]|jgi:alkylated DNA repair dioxygenase AlkB|nr:alpha-ketoglutarate-dependent dioxygenase AlkB [Rhodanobacteraceae bacterium]
MLRRLPLDGADVRCCASAFSPQESQVILTALLREIPWEQHRLHIFGREVDAPRLSYWAGDPGSVYVYSRTRFEPQPWTPALATLRDDLLKRFDLDFNSVLANLYRSGRDSMGWHSDDEPELGREPVIASLSFGAVRRFRFRSRQSRRVALAIELAHGSLLVMRGATQRLYQHDLPKTAATLGPRVNLTFRSIRADA